MKQIDTMTFVSEDNMTFVHIDDLTTDLGPVIQIGVVPNTDILDSIDNYTEVEKMESEEPEEVPATFNLRKNIKSKTIVGKTNKSNNKVTLSFTAEVDNEFNYINNNTDI